MIWTPEDRHELCMLEDEIRCHNFGGKAVYTVLPAPSSVHSGKTCIECKIGTLKSMTSRSCVQSSCWMKKLKTNKNASLKSLGLENCFTFKNTFFIHFSWLNSTTDHLFAKQLSGDNAKVFKSLLRTFKLTILLANHFPQNHRIAWDFHPCDCVTERSGCARCRSPGHQRCGVCWSLQYSFQPQSDALRLQRAATQGRSGAEMMTEKKEQKKKIQKKKKIERIQTSASSREGKCASTWRSSTDAIRCHFNLHKLLTHWLDLPPCSDIKLVLVIAWALITLLNKLFWSVQSVVSNLLVSQEGRAVHCALMIRLVMSDYTRAPVTCCSLAQLSLMWPAAISDLIREEGP